MNTSARGWLLRNLYDVTAAGYILTKLRDLCFLGLLWLTGKARMNKLGTPTETQSVVCVYWL